MNQRGIPFLLFAYPHGHQTAAREWREGRQAYAFEQNAIYTGTFFPFLAIKCQEYRVNCYLLLDIFRAYAGEELLFLPFNGHFTSAGQKLLAESQYQAILQGNYLAVYKKEETASRQGH